jgi:cytosine/adenosine deaminase-related metal-dependent hydrolase
MIIRSRVVATMAGEPIDDGGVLVAGNKIAGIGRFAELKRDYPGEVLDLGEQVLLPGLINAHCHLDYTMLRGKIPPQRSFTDWIRAINAEKAALTTSDYRAAITAGFAEAQSFGTTTLVNLTAFPELVAAITEPVRTWWFGELIDVRNPEQAAGIVDRAVDSLRSAINWGLAPHAPFTASRELYARCAEIARRENVLLTTHLAESREEWQMFRDASGPLFDFLKSIGRSMEECGMDTPLSRLLRNQTLDRRWIIAHLNELDAGDFGLLTHAPKFHIAHCPRSHTFFGHAPFALERLRALGFNICLGTDSLASNSSLSLFAEMRELLRNEASLSPRDIVEMVTVNAADAIGQGTVLGQIRPGFCADLIAIPDTGDTASLFERIVHFEAAVPWVMIGGEVLKLPRR